MNFYEFLKKICKISWKFFKNKIIFWVIFFNNLKIKVLNYKIKLNLL